MTPLADISTPPSWSQVPVWSLAKRISEKGHPRLPLLSVYREHGVVRREDRDDNHNQASEDLNAYQRVLPGDIVLNKMKTWQGSLGVSVWEGIISPAYFVCRLNSPAVVPSFLHYLLRSRPYVATYAALSKGIRPGQWDLPWDEFRALPVLLPPVQEQRQIAAFLDDQVALLDRAIGLRQQQIDLLNERHEAHREESMLRPGVIFRPVSGLLSTRISDGPHETPEWSNEGVPFLSVDSVVNGELNFDACRYITAEDHARYSLKAKPEYGDVLVTKAASIGKVAEVKVHLDFNVWSPIAILRPATEVVSTSYLANALRLRKVQSDLRLTANTSTQANLSMSALGRVRVPYVPLAEQQAIAGAVQSHLDTVRGTERLLTHSLALLTERKQSLITAAVTGQFDVTTARKVSVNV